MSSASFIRDLHRIARITTEEPIPCPCKDCESDVTYTYMIKPELWAELGLKDRDNVCLPCLRRRCARLRTGWEIPLRAEDFTDAFCNDLVKDMCEVFTYD
jgi:hypothetical protein